VVQTKKAFCGALLFSFLAWGATQAQPGDGFLPFEHRVRVLIEKGNAVFSSVPLVFLELAGVALFDYDGDGDPDVYLTNGPGFENALLQNDAGVLSQNVAPLAAVNYLGGTGPVTGDLDNDGDADLFVARRNKNVLYRNDGDGRFTDITDEAGVAGADQLSINATFCDFDNDGLLDLYVSNRRLGIADDAHHNQLFHNLGGLTFSEIAQAAGVANPVTQSYIEPGRGQNSSMAAACLDYDLDGDQDLAVAVDFSTVTLFKNVWQETGQLRFENVTLETGLGRVGNWMGLAVGDFNNDRYPDLFATNWGNSPNIFGRPIPVDDSHPALYLNNGDGTFTNVSEQAGLAHWPFGWGAAALDWDNDGDLDLYYVGNFVENPTKPVRDNAGHLFLNDGAAHFREASDTYDVVNDNAQGVYQVGHGVATGDLDGDGFFDLLVANSAFRTVDNVVIPGVPRLFRNDKSLHAHPGHWLTLRLVGTASNRSAVGARVLAFSDGVVQSRTVRSGAGHMASSSLELGFGFGQRTNVDRLEVHWPSGLVDVLSDVPVDQALTLVEGQHPLP